MITYAPINGEQTRRVNAQVKAHAYGRTTWPPIATLISGKRCRFSRARIRRGSWEVVPLGDVLWYYATAITQD